MDKKIKEEVKKEVKKEESKKKHYYKKKNHNVKKFIKKEVRKEEKKQGNQGPKPKFSVKVTATIGYIDGNKEHGPNLKIATFLHPSLCKGPDEDRAFGPLQAAAAQYGLWRLSKVVIRMTPLVGSSAVSGTVVRLSSNLTQTPGSTSWGGLGARKHRDFQAGRSGSFILTRQDVAGPRAGGWWVTDTNTEGAQSAGPVIEAHCLGKTSSTYQDRDWTGQLFIVELTGRWEFANYNNNPALGSLERHESAVSNAKLTTDQNGEIQLELPSQSGAALFMNDPTTPRAGQGETPGEIVYQIVDTAAGLAGSALPPPFGWLVKGGWWFLKKIIGRSKNSTDTFKVYASLSDAQNNKPAISTQKSLTGTAVTTELHITQMNSPNLGGASANPLSSGVAPAPLWPVVPSGPATGSFRASLTIQPLHVYGSQQTSVHFPAIFESASVNRPGGHWLPAAHFRILSGNYYTVNGQNLTTWNTFPTSYKEMRLDSRCVNGREPGGQDTLMCIVGHSSTRISNSLYLHKLIWYNTTTSATWSTMDSVKPRIVSRPQPDTNDIRILEQSSTNVVAPESSINGSRFLSLVLTNSGSTFDSLKNQDTRPPGYPANHTPLGNVDPLFGVLMQVVLKQGSIQIEADFTATPARLSKLEKLAHKLGVDLSELSDESDEYHTDADSDTDSDSDDDLQFENVTHTDTTSKYERLREAGFEHEEAARLSKM